MMSHATRTALNAVITIASLLKPHLTDEGSQLLEALSLSSHNLLGIINDILDFRKLDLGKVTLENSSVDFHDLITSIKNIYLPMANEKGLSLEISLDNKFSEYYELDETKMSTKPNTR
jgi:signal transduction histidine kinase